ncbi:lytic transglycosylase domain-containing protein [Pseudomonas sp. PB3P13]
MSIINISQHRNAPQTTAQDPAVARQARLEAAAEQFEAMFLQQILKQMRKAGDVLSEGSFTRSRQSDTLREFHDEALADTLATRRESGIAGMLVRQLSRSDALSTQPGVQKPHHDLPPAAAPPPLGESLLTPIVATWQRGVERLERGAAGLKALVAQVIAHESGGQTAAISHKGARGLMQLMPGTAREMAERLNLPYSEHRLTTDPAYNKRLGTTYLTSLIERYDGVTALALAAYNAGPGRVDEWLKVNGDPRHGVITEQQWVERIPFKETRQYTRSILAGLVRDGRLQESLKSSVDSVALDPEAVTSTANHTPAFRSAAFAPNMWIVRKEIES